MRIELTAGITGGDVHGGQVAGAGYLNVIGSLNEMSSFNRAGRNETSSVSGLGSKVSVREMERDL